MEKLVYSVSVKTKHIFTDGLTWARNVLGRNLVSYENMLSAAIAEAMNDLYLRHPDVYDVKIMSTNITKGAAEIVVYGKVKYDV